MLTVYTAPESLDLTVWEGAVDLKPSLFLGGSIEQGKAVDWQAQVCEACANENYIFLNPRRRNWGDLGVEELRRQVEWELTGLELADAVLINLLPDTLSPISLLELGLYCRESPHKLVVVCPDGFWRKTNIEVTCEKYSVPLYNDLSLGLEAALTMAHKQFFRPEY